MPILVKELELAIVKAFRFVMPVWHDPNQHGRWFQLKRAPGPDETVLPTGPTIFHLPKGSSLPGRPPPSVVLKGSQRIRTGPAHPISLLVVLSHAVTVCQICGISSVDTMICAECSAPS